MQRLSVSLCNPCTPQYSIPPEDEFLNFYENLSPPPLPTHTLSLTPSSTDKIDVNTKSEDNVLFSKCMIPVTFDSQDNGSSEDEFLIEKENNVVDLCSDTSLNEEPTFIQLKSTGKSCSKKSIRKRELSKSNRDRISSDMFQSFNETVFNNQLPEMLSISWNTRLVKTAGLTHCKEIKESNNNIITRQASIEISVKVVDSKRRLHETLLHELCHAAAWLLDGAHKPPHGAVFRKWADKVEQVYPDTVVSTCHSYNIFRPHVFLCTSDICGQEYSRHSKKGLDTDRSLCGKCGGTLRYAGMKNFDGTMAAPKTPSAFCMFVKEKFSAVKSSERLTSHKDVMKKLATLFKESKRSIDDHT
eukprot:gene22368-30617_t